MISITIKYNDYSTKLRVSDASRAESGTYTIIAENCNGRDSVDVEVIVLGEICGVRWSGSEVEVGEMVGKGSEAI